MSCAGVLEGYVHCSTLLALRLTSTDSLQHVLGSQVFDYWFDTSKFMVEHYADGDLEYTGGQGASRTRSFVRLGTSSAVSLLVCSFLRRY
jgi:hypothetical protein